MRSRAGRGEAHVVLRSALPSPSCSVWAATPAAAAAVPTIQAKITNHRGTNGSGTLNPTTNNTSVNCIRHDPGSDVWSSTRARAGHGNQIVNYRTRTWIVIGYTSWSSWRTENNCPTNLGTGYTDNGNTREEYSRGQSIIELTPGGSPTVAAGTSFLLGTFRHYNNPITATANYFEGTLGLQVGSTTFSSSYVLHETPNNAEPASDAANNDTVTFGQLIRSEPVTLNGISYRLSVQGFTPAGTGDVSCAATPTGSFSSVVSTVEETTTVACLWARLDQVRPLTIVKQAAAAGDAPASVPAATFTSASTLAGSPWTAPGFSLAPTGVTAPGNTASLAARSFQATGERVTVTEGVPATSWELSAISCRDGAGAPVTSGVNVNLAARSLVLENVPEAASASAAPITCTFVNTYVAPTTLTLVSTTIPTGSTPVATAGWSFTVDALGSPLTTAGAGGSATATVPVTGATRVVQVTETVQSGYVFDSMSCRRNDQPTASFTSTVNPSGVTLERGRSYTCTVLNLRPSVDLVKQAFLATDTGFLTPLAAGQLRDAGTAVVWRYTVRNTGQTTLGGIVLRDATSVSVTGGGTTSGFATISCPGRPDIAAGTTVTIPSLAPGQEIRCQSSGVL